MTQSEAAKCAVHAGELFRFVTDAVAIVVAEQMAVVPTHEEGIEILKSLVGIDPENRLDLFQLKAAIERTPIMLAKRRIDRQQAELAYFRAIEARRAEVERFAKLEADARAWLATLTPELIGELTIQAIQRIPDGARHLFNGRTLRTSWVLLQSAYEHRKIHE